MSVRLLTDPTTIAAASLPPSVPHLPLRAVKAPARLVPLRPALLLFAAMATPLAAVLVLSLDGDASWWAHLADTLLAEYVLTTLGLCLGVALLTLIMGAATAWLVTSYSFPGRNLLEWAL